MTGQAEYEERMVRAARQAHAQTLRAGAINYERARHLPRLIRAVPSEYSYDDRETAERIIGRLARALAAERRRGRSGHWTYDMNRHIALKQALAAERAHLRTFGNPRKGWRGPVADPRAECPVPRCRPDQAGDDASEEIGQ